MRAIYTGKNKRRLLKQDELILYNKEMSSRLIFGGLCDRNINIWTSLSSLMNVQQWCKLFNGKKHEDFQTDTF